MLLEETDRYQLHRRGRYLYAALARPHRVLSTCRINGGLREDLSHVANHQGCEGVAHDPRGATAVDEGPGGYHVRACEDAGLPPSRTALMATAANMQCAVLGRAAEGDLAVTVAATAGVLGNATRAGDRAGWVECEEGCRARGAASETAPPERGAGTIITLVFINQPCTPACLVRAATLVTEGKSAAVLDLRVPSLQSSALATGTGTDQLAIAAPLAREGEWERQWAGGHNLLGELLGHATHQAVTRSLLLQNGLCPELRRNLCGALGRHGCDEQALCRAAERWLAADLAEVFARNLQALVHDPLSAAAAFALAEVLDLARDGVLHAEVAREAVLNQAAQLGTAVAVRPDAFVALRERLLAEPGLAPAELAALAVVEGFARKWN